MNRIPRTAAWGLTALIICGCSAVPGDSGRAGRTTVRVNGREAGTPATPEDAPALPPVGRAPGGSQPVKMVLLPKGANPSNPDWFQVDVRLLEGSRYLLPEGAFFGRLRPADGPDGRPPVIGGVRWEVFEPVPMPIPTNWWGGGRVMVFRDKNHPDEWTDCVTALQLPHKVFGDLLPAGTTDARVVLEFEHNDPRRRPGPEAVNIPLPRPAEGLRTPTAAARSMRLEAAPSAAGGTGFEDLRIGLLDAAGAFTLAEGEIVLSAAAARPGEESAPEDPQNYAPFAAAGAPVAVGRRYNVDQGRSSRVEYWRSLSLPRSRMAEILPAGATSAWVRVEFQPADRKSPVLSAAVSVPLRR